MKINKQYQALHIKDHYGIDWVLIQQIEKDICLLYHQLSEYSYIMPDLYYGDVYRSAYWEYLNIQGLDDDKLQFIQQGCLVIILAMCLEIIDTTGTYIYKYLDECKKHIQTIVTENEDTKKLISIVLQAIHMIKEDKHDDPDFIEETRWVHKKFVRGYFNNIADDFRNNEYFK